MRSIASAAPFARLAPLALAASAFAFAACSGESASPAGPSGDPADGAASTGQRADALVYRGSCTPSSCPPFDPSSTANVATCSESGPGSCGWNTGPDTSVSFRQCEAAQCGAKPTLACPEGYQASEGACGAENDGPCAWQTRCTPKVTEEPCPDAECGPVQDIAAICSEDGGFEGPIAEWRCRKLSTGACTWQTYCAQ